MSNTYKTLIAILTLSILAGATMIYFNSQARNIDKFTTISSPSPFQADSSQSLQVKSVISSSQAIKPISSQTASEVKVSQVSVVQTGQTTENIDGVKVTYLDSKNPPQYIKDYLACETNKLPNHYDAFILKNNQNIYKCPPTLAEAGCSNGVLYYGLSTDYYKTKDGWLCDAAMGTPMECNIAIENIINNPETPFTFKDKYINAKSMPTNEGDQIGDCLVFTKSKLSIDEIKSIAKYNPAFIIINYSN